MLRTQSAVCGVQCPRVKNSGVPKPIPMCNISKAKENSIEAMKEQLDFDALREAMVDRHLKIRGIKNQRVLEVFRKIPRHKFIPSEFQSNAYGDFPLPIGNEQTISQPYIVALMTESLDIKNTDRVLEIGTGSGYQTAILSELSHHVYSVERIEHLAKKAKSLLDELQCCNVSIQTSDGTLGWKENAPYDKIIVTAGAPTIPHPLTEQLQIGGRLIIPVSNFFGQTLILATKEKDGLQQEKICGCTFVPLIGQYGHKG